MRSASQDCPVCRSQETEIFLRRRSVPVHQNMVFEEQAMARSMATGHLELTFCHSCGFVFNAAFDESLLHYGATYDNTQCCSPAFNDYLDELVQRMVERGDITRKRIVEVGCGKGHFLRRLIAYPGAGNRGIGFDPSYEGPLNEMAGRLRYERRFYGPTEAEEAADVVVCRHVIEHVGDPVALLQSVRAAMGEGARLYLETPCVEWILRHGVAWDFFYEHCSLMTVASLATACQMAGFVVLRTDHVFGDQYIWLEAVASSNVITKSKQAGEVPGLSRAFGVAERSRIKNWKDCLSRTTGLGSVAIWGAGAKGVTFANLVDPRVEYFDCVIDLNPNKQGKYLPGTGHPIVGVASLEAQGVEYAILMNPNYGEENRRLLAELGIKVNLLDWHEIVEEGANEPI